MMKSSPTSAFEPKRKMPEPAPRWVFDEHENPPSTPDSEARIQLLIDSALDEFSTPDKFLLSSSDDFDTDDEHTDSLSSFTTPESASAVVVDKPLAPPVTRTTSVFGRRRKCEIIIYNGFVAE